MRPLLAFLVVLPALALAGCVKDPPPADGDGAADLPRHELRFSGDDAMDLVKLQVQGPNGSAQYRVPGTPSHARVSQLLENEFATLGYTTAFQSWGGDYGCESTPLRNIVAVRTGATNRTYVLGAHYDTRPVADKDPDPAKRTQPVLGANDGASGVAVLLELADALRGRAPNLTLVFVLFDAEDGGDLPCPDGTSTGWIMGSLRFMSLMKREQANVTEGVIIVDMVGDEDLELRREGFSDKGPGKPLQEAIWATGIGLGHDDVFIDELGPQITDDHRAFLDPPAEMRFGRKLPAVDLIHIDGGPDIFPDTHHTTFDDLDHVSAASLEAVGRTLEHVLLDLDAGPIAAS